MPVILAKLGLFLGSKLFRKIAKAIILPELERLAEQTENDLDNKTVKLIDELL